MNVPPPLWNLEDRIAHHLSGAVIRHVAATSGLEEIDAAGPKRVLGDEEVLGARVTAERDYRIVLEEEEGVSDGAALPFVDETLLKGQTLGVGDPAKAPDVEPREGTARCADGSRGRGRN